MQLLRVEDGRDNLQKMTRDELWLYARANGVEFPDGYNTMREDMTTLNRPNMISILRSKGLNGIINRNILGQPEPKPEVSVAEAVGYKRPEVKAEAKAVADMTRAELAKETKRRGMKMARTDSKEALRERLSVQATA